MSEKRYGYVVTQTPVGDFTTNGAKVATRIKLYSRLLRAAIAACAAIFELITGEKPPGSSQVLRGKD